MRSTRSIPSSAKVSEFGPDRVPNSIVLDDRISVAATGNLEVPVAAGRVSYLVDHEVTRQVGYQIGIPLL